MGHLSTLPWVRSRVWIRVGLGPATGKGWVGMWPVTRLDLLNVASCYIDVCFAGKYTVHKTHFTSATLVAYSH